tara:strand:- start:275 stop:1576 length:1302 start_codon:yes stop_codon:yes gene_type:complete
MKLVIVGTGYVGLVSGLCFSELGFETICVDRDAARINELKKGVCPIFEPGVNELLEKHLNNTKLISFTTSIKEAMKNSDIVFITVGTPTRRINNEADLTSIMEVAEEIAENINSYCVVVTKSTVPPGTTNDVKDIIKSKVLSENFDVVSNPEFLKEGSAINDFMQPDRVVIGADSEKPKTIIKNLYKNLNLKENYFFLTTIESSEIIKYASNSFLATKIAFINQVSDLCEKVGANIQDVSRGMGLDKRIGAKFLEAGPGYGGSCFPKDVKAFINSAKKNDVNFSILETVDLSNEIRPKEIVEKIINLQPFDSSSTICLLGLTFKPNTNDIRDSTSIKIAKLLHEKKIKINCYDPAISKSDKLKNNQFNYFESPYEACNNVNAIIVGTEWKEFLSLDFAKIKKSINEPIIFDLRNIYNQIEIEKLGFVYYGIGK